MKHQRVGRVRPLGIAALVVACVAGAVLAVLPGPGSAAVGDTVTQTVQKGVRFLVPDAVTWDQNNNCNACHRQGAAMFGLANALASGYQVDTSDTTGLGF